VHFNRYTNKNVDGMKLIPKLGTNVSYAGSQSANTLRARIRYIRTLKSA